MIKNSSMRTHARVAAAVALAALLGAVVGSVADARGEVPSWSSYDDEIAQANKEKAAQQERSDQLAQALSETDKGIVDATLKLDALNQRLPGVQEEYRLAQERYDSAILQQKIVASKLAAAKAEDAALTKQIAEDDEKVEELRGVLAEIARTAYQDAQQDQSLSIIFGATTSQEFVDQYAYRETSARVQSATLSDVEQLAAVNKNRKIRQEAVREYIQDLKDQADALVIETQTAKDAAEAKKAEVERLLAEAQKLKDYLESQRTLYLQQQAELEAAQAALANELDQLWRQKLAEEATNGTGSLEKGFLSPPTAVPYITSAYGWRIHPIYGYRKLHAGTDFRAYCGTAIKASADGKVEWATLKSGFGNQVMLYNGVVSGKVLFTSYNHMSKFNVVSGQTVKRGDVLGYSGSTGTSTSCHLHFEVYVNGVTVDPMLYVADW